MLSRSEEFKKLSNICPKIMTIGSQIRNPYVLSSRVQALERFQNEIGLADVQACRWKDISKIRKSGYLSQR
jgi:hypothetical protein